MRVLFIVLTVGLAALGGVSGRLWNAASWHILMLSGAGALVGAALYFSLGHALARRFNARRSPKVRHQSSK